MAKKKYDLIFGMGAACPCSQVLRKYNLQFCSYPLDWVFGNNFHGRVELLLSEFKNFINKEDLIFSYEEKRYNSNAYSNKVNSIVFNHDFPKCMDFQEAYIQAKEKYDRRINRLISHINKAKSILIVYLEIPSTDIAKENNEKILESYNKLVEKYPNKKIDLYYIENKIGQECIKEKLSDNVTKYTLDYKKQHESLDYLVNQDKLKCVFENISLNGAKTHILKKHFNKMWISLIPVKSLKDKLGKKFHV